MKHDFKLPIILSADDTALIDAPERRLIELHNKAVKAYRDDPEPLGGFHASKLLEAKESYEFLLLEALYERYDEDDPFQVIDALHSVAGLFNDWNRGALYGPDTMNNLHPSLKK
jgi:hypothetical protein